MITIIWCWCIIMTSNIGNDTSASTPFSMDRTNKTKKHFHEFIYSYCTVTARGSLALLRLSSKFSQSSFKVHTSWNIEKLKIRIWHSCHLTFSSLTENVFLNENFCFNVSRPEIESARRSNQQLRWQHNFAVLFTLYLEKEHKTLWKPQQFFWHLY